MARFSDDFIEKVRDANRIEDVIGQYTELKKAGANLMGLCPFPDHQERSASFSVSSTRQFYHCFGCKKGGNVITFLTTYKGLSFPESIEYLAQKAGIALPQENYEKDSSSNSEKKDLKKINSIANLFYQSQLKKAPQRVKDYVTQRGLSAETVELFQLGFASEDWNNLTDHLRTKQVSMPRAESLGLIKKKREGQGHFDILRNRLIFPIFSQDNEVIGFGGRTLGDDNAKYINSPESLLFSKGKIFYGLHETAKFIRAKDQVIVVEGYMDFLALYGAGIKNVLATLGTALTLEHAKTIKRFTKNVILLFDGDSAGQAASERSLPILLQEGLYVKGLLLDGAKDPDEFVKKFGGEKLEGLVPGAPDLFQLILNKQLKNFVSSPSEKVKLIERMGFFLTSVSEPALKDLYIKEICQRIGESTSFAYRVLSKEMSKTVPAKSNELSPPLTPKTLNKNNNLTDTKIPKEDIELLNLALVSEQNLKLIIEENGQELATDKIVSRLLSKAIELYRQNPSGFDRLTASLTLIIERANRESAERATGRQIDPSLVTQHLNDKRYSRDETEGYKLLKKYIQYLKVKHLKAQAEEIKNKSRLTNDPENLERFMNILRDVKSLEQGD